MADLGADLGLVFPDLNDGQRQRLRAALPDFVTLSNPFDYNTTVWGDQAAQGHCFTTILEGEVDGAVLVLDYPSRRLGWVPR